MKLLLSVVMVSSLAIAAKAQKPFYAQGSFSSGYPSLASRFQTTDNESESGTAQGVNVNNRIGEVSTSTSAPLPVDALGDADLVNRISQWPKEQQPFWYLNHKAIEAARGRPYPEPNQQAPEQTQQVNIGSRNGVTQERRRTSFQ